MKTINLNFALKGLDGKEIPEANAGKLLANQLASDNGKNPVKFFTWAQLFYAGQTIEIDNQDLELLKTFITDSQQLTALVKAQVLEFISNAENKK